MAVSLRGPWRWLTGRMGVGVSPPVGVPVSAGAGLRGAVSAAAGVRTGPNMVCCDADAERLIPIRSDARVFYEGASADQGVTYLAAGIVSYALEDADGVTVASGALTYDGGGTGDYYATIDRAVTALLTEDADYYLEITYTDGAGNDDFRRIKYRAGYRGAS